MKKIIFLYALAVLFATSGCVEQGGESDATYADTTYITPQKKSVAKKEKEQTKRTKQKKQTVSQTAEKGAVLPSWNDTETKEKIIDFVKAVTTEGSADYVPPMERVATFDNDGTLWVEQPTYIQVEFILDRIKELAPQHPEWKKNKLIQTALAHDLEKLRKKYGVTGLGKLMEWAQSGMPTDEFDKIVQDWISRAKHPVTGKLYTDMVYQPMVELIDYLKKNDFKVYIVSGGGIDFIRVWAGGVYGIPRDHILGSLSRLQYEKVNGKPVLIKQPDILFLNEGDGKPKTIHRFIDKKPILAFGNTDGDIQMLEWCASNKYKNLPVIIHHTDSLREWDYDKISRMEKQSLAVEEAKTNGWVVVDMKNDWKVVFPFDKPAQQVTMK